MPDLSAELRKVVRDHERARVRRDRAIASAAKRGMTYRAIALATGLSRARIAQIVAEQGT